MRTFAPIAAGSPPAAQAARVLSPAKLRWIVPDLALTGAIITVLYLILLFGGATSLFRDADSGWHIRAGERMLSSGSLLHRDPFSFSKAGEPWLAWEWGSDVISAAIHRVTGLNGVAFVYALAIAACVWMWFRLNWAAGGNFLLACLFAAPMLSTVNLHWLARPHVFGWLFLLGTVWFCERMPRPLRKSHLIAAGVIACMWANMHGSFFLGPAIAIIYAAGAELRRQLWGGSYSGGNHLRIALAALAGTFINPYGWNLHLHVFRYLSDSALLDRVGEFQSFNFHSEGAAQIVLAMLIAAAGGCAALSARRPERLLLAMLLLAGGLRSARLLPIVALLLLPLANGSIAAVLSNVDLTARLRRRLDAGLDYGLNLRVIDRRYNGMALVPVVGIALFFSMHASFPADQFPVGASAAVSTLPSSARVFASDKFGGYLIYRFSGERKVFFDGRSDFYGSNFLARYSRMVQARPGWEKDFASWGFTHALLPPDYSLLAALETRGWKEIYRDKTAVLLKDPGV